MIRSQTRLLLAAGLTAAFATSASAVVVVNDSFADGDLAKTGALDSNWWTSSSSSGIEIAPGTLGLVTGTSGRGIHTVFDTQTLVNIGDSITAAYTFTTPDTIGTNSSSSFRVGLFDTLGRAGLDDNISASSGSPNPLYGDTGIGGTDAGLPGFMMDMDINTAGSEDLVFRQHVTTAATGRLMSTTGAGSFNSISPSGPDGEYAFAPNTTYNGSLTITLISATEVEIAGSLDGATHSVTSTFDSLSFGFLGFHANSNVFGSSGNQGEADNGIDFSNVTITFNPVPEPGTLTLGLLGALALLGRRRQA